MVKPSNSHKSLERIIRHAYVDNYGTLATRDVTENITEAILSSDWFKLYVQEQQDQLLADIEKCTEDMISDIEERTISHYHEGLIDGMTRVVRLMKWWK